MKIGIKFEDGKAFFILPAVSLYKGKNGYLVTFYLAYGKMNIGIITGI
jgi:hypothetical protein